MLQLLAPLALLTLFTVGQVSDAAGQVSDAAGDVSDAAGQVGDAPQGEAWKQTKDADRIQVYERDYPGSDFHQLKIVMEVDASVEAVHDLADDIPAFEEWVYKCVEARDLGDDARGGYYYTRVDVPWPMDDRDLAVCVEGTVDPATGIYTSVSNAVPDKVPPVDGVVRMTKYHVETSYVPSADGTVTTLTYVMHSEPGGNVPAWISNMFIDRGPLTSMRRFRSLLESRERVANGG